MDFVGSLKTLGLASFRILIWDSAKAERARAKRQPKESYAMKPQPRRLDIGDEINLSYYLESEKLLQENANRATANLAHRSRTRALNGKIHVQIAQQASLQEANHGLSQDAAKSSAQNKELTEKLEHVSALARASIIEGHAIRELIKRGRVEADIAHQEAAEAGQPGNLDDAIKALITKMSMNPEIQSMASARIDEAKRQARVYTRGMR